MAQWLSRYMELAVLVGSWSKDRSKLSPGVGCVIVDISHTLRSVGYNGFPRGVVDEIDSRHERPTKYQWTVHAEPNAVANAARNGVSTMGCTAYINKTPCPACMGILINAGIVRVVCPKPDKNNEMWCDSEIAEDMAKEAGLDIVWNTLIN